MFHIVGLLWYKNILDCVFSLFSGNILLLCRMCNNIIAKRNWIVLVTRAVSFTHFLFNKQYYKFAKEQYYKIFHWMFS